MTLPSFSIVVPTYQRRELVCDVIDGLCKIDYVAPIELIVVIDGSTDGTTEALSRLECPFPVKLVYQPNAGLAAARNRGAREATNDVILFLDDDMICRPDILSQHAATLQAGADAVLGHIPLDPQSPPGFLSAGVGAWAEERAKRLAKGAQLTLFDLVGGHMSVRREIFEQTGGFDQRFTDSGTYGDEDLDLGTRLTGQFNARFNPEAVAFQRYVVTAEANMRQWYEAGQADVAFARKHPQRARELFELHGARSWRTRLLLRPLSYVPLLPHLIAAIAVRLVSLEQRSKPSLRRLFAVLFYASRDILYWRGVRDAGGVPGDHRLLILCYHAIADLSDDPVLGEYGVGPRAFQRQLDNLLAAGFSFVSPDELVSLLEGSGCVPSKALLLTFDDCYEELAHVARDMLEPRDIPAMAFAVSGTRTGTNEWDQAIGARKLRLLDAKGLRELGVRGVEIGCHSRTHRPLPGVADGSLAEETANSANDLSRLGVPRPRFFAYPHGAQDHRSRTAVRNAGFTAAFGLAARRVGPKSERFALPRIEILASDGPARFWLKTRWPRASLYLLYAAAIPRRAGSRLLRLLSAAPPRRRRTAK